MGKPGVIPGQNVSAVSEAPHEGRSIVPMRFERALQIQRLEGSRPGGLWDLYLDGAVLIVCEFAVAVRALGFQERVAERMSGRRRIGGSESHHHTAF